MYFFMPGELLVPGERFNIPFHIALEWPFPGMSADMPLQLSIVAEFNVAVSAAVLFWSGCFRLLRFGCQTPPVIICGRWHGHRPPRHREYNVILGWWLRNRHRWWLWSLLIRWLWSRECQWFWSRSEDYRRRWRRQRSLFFQLLRKLRSILNAWLLKSAIAPPVQTKLLNIYEACILSTSWAVNRM